MSDLKGRQLQNSYQDVATWGSGNQLEDGDGNPKVNLDDKVSLSIALVNRDIDLLPVSDTATKVDYRNGNTIQKKRKVPRATTDRTVYKLVTGSSGGQGQGGWEITLIGVGQRSGSSSDRQRIEKWLVSRDIDGNFDVVVMAGTGSASSAFTHNQVSDGLEIILRGSVSNGLTEGGVLIQVTGMRGPQNRGNSEQEWIIEVPSL